MRRLTLILSDLYLAEEEAPDAMPAPNLEWLLRFADRTESIGDWRTWLASELGYAPADIQPFASFAGPPGAWFASPLHLLAALDHVRLPARGALTLDATQRGLWCEAFARTFGPQYTLHDDGVRGFFLTGLAPADVSTTDPARLLGADIASGLPRGAEAGELRRLMAEVEMWLHSEPLNDERVRRGSAPVSSLWLWGGGSAASNRPASRGGLGTATDVGFTGADAFVAALARHAGKTLCAVPRDAPRYEAGSTAAHEILVLAPMSGEPRTTLAEVDRLWIGDARRRIERGVVLDLVANDRVARISGHASWRFWRPRTSWAAALSRPAAHPEA